MGICQKKKGNELLYTIEGIGALLVVFLHYRLPGNIGTYVAVIAKSVVPFFFMVSGYYFATAQNKEDIRLLCGRRINKLLLLLAVGIVIYGVTDCIFSCFVGRDVFSVDEWLREYFSWEILGDLVLFNILPIPLTTHLWFLLALIYCYILQIPIAGMTEKNRFIFDVVVIMLPLVAYAVEVYIGVHNQELVLQAWTDVKYYRNWLLDGLPFFTIGRWVYQYRLSIISKMKGGWKGALLCIFLVTMYLENEWYSFWLEYSIGTIGFSVVLFCFCVSSEDIHCPKNMVWLGSQASMVVYLIHPLYLGVIQKILPHFPKLSQNVLVAFASPVMVAVLSVVTAWIVGITKKEVLHKCPN